MPARALTNTLQIIYPFAPNVAKRLEVTMGSGCAPFSTLHGSSPHGDIPAVAESLSALRLHFEETVVRLYSCQRSVSTILRDPAASSEEAWEGVRHELADALESTRTGGTDEELWRKAEQLVDSKTKGNSSREAVGGCFPSSNQENLPGVLSVEWCCWQGHLVRGSKDVICVFQVSFFPAQIICALPSNTCRWWRPSSQRVL